MWMSLVQCQMYPETHSQSYAKCTLKMWLSCVKETKLNNGVMNIIMNNLKLESIEEVKAFLTANKNTSFTFSNRKDKYEFIRDTLVKLRYTTTKKKDKGIIKKYLRKITGYSPQQIKRLIREWKDNGLIYKKRPRGKSFQRKYEAKEIALLIKTDSLHRTPNGEAVRKILQREFAVFGNDEYETIANISRSHIYNIRNNSQQYLSSEAIKYSKTVPVSTDIGERRKPNPEGKPGFLRVDSVHQGDFEGVKGVYHINIVDEVTQFEIVGCVEKISDFYIIPMLEDMLKQLPFKVVNFHSDNGSEYINRQVRDMLNRLLIKQTKSRSRKTNDNALAESKNGAVIRKHMGRNHIPQEKAPIINEWYKSHFNTYINYHRICGFATDYVDKRGKIKKKYDKYMTPYEKLKLVDRDGECLKEGVTFEELDKIAYACSDNEFAEKMKKAKILMSKKLLKN